MDKFFPYILPFIERFNFELNFKKKKKFFSFSNIFKELKKTSE